MRTRFQYATIARFRANTGISVGTLDDATIKAALERASNAVNLITQQIFLPIYEVALIDGTGDNLVNHSKLLPIMAVDELSVNADKNLAGTENRRAFHTSFSGISGSEILGTNSYEITEDEFGIRFIASSRLIGQTVFGFFPRGVRNIKMTGLFGWLEPRRNYTTTTTTELTDSSLTVTVDDSSNVEVRDILLFRDFTLNAEDPLIWVEVVSVDYDTNIITFEALGKVRGLPILIGSTVRSFGKIPDAINLATITITKNRELGNIGGSSAIPDDVKSMRTDRFAFTKFSPGQTGGTKATTGDEYADFLLQHYAAPPYLGAI